MLAAVRDNGGVTRRRLELPPAPTADGALKTRMDCHCNYRRSVQLEGLCVRCVRPATANPCGCGFIAFAIDTVTGHNGPLLFLILLLVFAISCSSASLSPEAAISTSKLETGRKL